MRLRAAALLAMIAMALGGCGRAPAPRQAGDSRTGLADSPLELLRPSELDTHFAQALSPRPFVFPADHGPHPGYRHEWWYFTGHLKAEDGEEFGFELTFFRLALEPPAAAPAAASRWRARELYGAHFAVTDVARQRFDASERYARGALELAGARAAPLAVWVGPWSLAAEPAAPADRPVWQLRAHDERYGLELEVRALGAPVLNGEQGLSVKADEPGAASYYYSIPRLEVRGRLVRADRALAVSGIAWLDREWGSGALGRTQQGWDWFALELGDGSALMFYALRGPDGTRDPHSAGTWIPASGASRALQSAEVRIETLAWWLSPRGARYPSRWRVRVASLGLDVTLAPVLADQELDATPRYWEGKVSVTDSAAAQHVRGQGYVELVGYAR